MLYILLYYITLYIILYLTLFTTVYFVCMYCYSILLFVSYSLLSVSYSYQIFVNIDPYVLLLLCQTKKEKTKRGGARGPDDFLFTPFSSFSAWRGPRDCEFRSPFAEKTSFGVRAFCLFS